MRRAFVAFATAVVLAAVTAGSSLAGVGVLSGVSCTWVPVATIPTTYTYTVTADFALPAGATWNTSPAAPYTIIGDERGNTKTDVYSGPLSPTTGSGWQATFANEPTAEPQATVVAAYTTARGHARTVSKTVRCTGPA